MNASAHQFAGSIVHQSVPGQCGFACKNCSNNLNAEVTTLAGTGMTCVTVRFILDVQCQRLKAGQVRAQGSYRFVMVHGV